MLVLLLRSYEKQMKTAQKYITDNDLSGYYLVDTELVQNRILSFLLLKDKCKN